MYKLELTCTTPHAVNPTGLKNGKYTYKFDVEHYESTLIKMKNAGINKLEFVIPGVMYYEDSMKMLKTALKLVKKHKMTINSVHFPYLVYWLDFTCPWEKDREDIFNIAKKLFKIMDKFNPKAYIFHPGGENTIKIEDREKYMGYLVDAINYLADFTTVPLCIENMVLGAMTNGLEQLKDYSDRCEKGYVIIDTNHFLKDKPEDAIKAIGKDKLKALHISDNDFIYERHWLPGKGANDWNKIIGALEEIGYDGAFNYEINMERWGYSYEELVENYENLFKAYNESKQ